MTAVSSTASADDPRLAQAAVPMVALGGVLAQENAAAQAAADDWTFYFRPYAWLPRISGSVTVKGLSSRLVVTQGTVVRNLESAILLAWEGAKEDSFVRLDTVGFALGDDQGIPGAPNGRLDFRVELALAELDAGVRALDDGEQTLDLFTGLRFIYIKVRLDPKHVGVQGQSKSLDWVDPILGARYRRVLSDEWSMIFHADYGGFGIGSASESTYQGMALAEWKPTERWSFGGGWRYLMIEHSQGSGAKKVEEHLRFSGPVVGASYRF